MVVARGVKTGTLYITISCRDMVTVADAVTDSDLWHYMIGHISEKGMKVLQSKGKLLGLKIVNNSSCDGYIFGKQKRVSFSKAENEQKTTKLELVHTNVWGPSTVLPLVILTPM
ncbi:uncharacterized mitochondrial protein AtMg00300-like [Aristolochia californica]|uniref:uncharacterized mitochondrial protein AtMg00300-like n=1 Tax=Aristolochia californica TaxID=171875 RepID=UPI0035DD6EA2